MHKRILITSIPSWSQRSGSNTFSSLFSSFRREDVANIYIRPDIPDSETSSRYFNISESAVVKSCLKRNIITGREIEPLAHVQKEKEDALSPMTSYVTRKRLRLFLWLRELAWLLGRWDSAELNRFVEEVKPSVLVFPIESYPYFNRINERLIDRYQPEIVIGYLWDDNFTYKQHEHDPLFLVERFFLRKQVKRLAGMCTTILAISPKMKEECDAFLHTNSVVLTKPIFHSELFIPYKVVGPIRILYTGKINIGRDDTLIALADEIRKLNAYSQKVRLDIYTGTQVSEGKRQMLDIPGSSYLHEPVPQSEVFCLQKEADVLLFAESMSSADLTARLSFSTKLTDYFAAGKCILGIGNADLGPISYLKDEDSGLVCTTKDEISSVLRRIIVEPETIGLYARKAYDCGLRNHNAEEIINTLKKLTHYE